MQLPTPEFNGRRLLLVGSGAVSVLHMPFWLNWLAGAYPDLEVRVVLTRSAERFATRETLGLLSRRPALADRWPEEYTDGALHVRLWEWFDCALVYPACLNYIARLANGMGDAPSLLALQCSEAPIVVAPALPPGALTNPLVADHFTRLGRRPNVVVAPTRPSVSVTTGNRDSDGLVPMWTAVELLEGLRATRVAGPEAAPGPAPAADTPLTAERSATPQ